MQRQGVLSTLATDAGTQPGRAEVLSPPRKRWEGVSKEASPVRGDILSMTCEMRLWLAEKRVGPYGARLVSGPPGPYGRGSIMSRLRCLGSCHDTTCTIEAWSNSRGARRFVRTP